MAKEKSKNSIKRTWLVVLVVILSLILLLLLGGLALVYGVLSSFQRPEDVEQTLPQAEMESILQQENDVSEDFSGPVLESNDVQILPADVVIEDTENIFRIMLLGVDNRSTQYRSRTDAMILCTINRSAKTLTMTSFMRDTYVYIPEFYQQRLNVAYPVGGFGTLYDTLEYNFGVQVDKGVAVNFSSFQEVVDAIGGVDIVLTGAEAAYLNHGSGWWLQKGVNHLTGEQALAYSRIREIDSDYNRTNRQRNVMSAIIQKAQTLSVKELIRLVKVLMPMVVTDMSNKEIIDAAVALAPILKDITIVTQRIPVDDGHTMAMVDGMSVLIPDLEVNRQYLIDTIGLGEDGN